MTRGIHGIFNINKAPGMTSHDVVYAVRRITGEKKVGHAGTLDPAAVGVLPICVGQGTRVVQYLADTDKTYCAVVVLGVSTDTYDVEGKVTKRGRIEGLFREDVEKVLAGFEGEIAQVPPMYSALKVRGKPLYLLARAGEEVERAARSVRIFEIHLEEWSPPSMTIRVRCSKGTYIRSLANDIGEKLGCGAYLDFLARMRTGPFTLDEALTLSDLEEAFALGYWQELIYPLDYVLRSLPAWIVAREREQKIRHGQFLSGSSPGDSGLSKRRAYSLEGDLVALLEFDSEQGAWHPDTVFSYA